MRYPLTIRICAERAGVSPSMIYSALRQGTLNGRQFGRRRHWRISTEDFRAWNKARHNRLQANAKGRHQNNVEHNELAAQRSAQEKALQRFLADGDHEGAAVVQRALAATISQMSQ